MTRRLSVAVFAALLLAAGVASAQAMRWDDDRLFQRLGLTDQQISSIQDVVAREDKNVREAQAELNIYRAQLEKLLLDVNPDMVQVERLLRSSVDQKVKSELAVVRRRVEVRKIVGEQKWDQLLREVRANRVRAGRGVNQRPMPPAPAAPRSR